MLAIVLITLSLLALPAAATPAAAAPLEVLTGPAVDYPLRHDFSMAIGIPGHGDREPTSCYDAWDHEGYLCRIVSGYEDTGDRRNFLVRSQDALANGSVAGYGDTLVSRDGIQYEGCRQWRNGDWHCDYATRRHVSRDHYDGSMNSYVLKVLWEWRKHTSGQVGCATALAGWWGKYGRFVGVLDNCFNGPMERP
ncbi:MAG: hypothetical protein ACRDZ3_22720 [Acidimicrobiia bacterium]